MKSTQKEQKENKNGTSASLIILFFILTICCMVFSVLSVYGSSRSFFQRNALFLSVIASVLLATFCGVSVGLVVAKKNVICKTLVGVYAFILFCVLLIFILQRTGFFQIIQNENSLQTYLEGAGRWMATVYILLQYLQVVILPIPSLVSTAAGVALFGPLRALIYSLIGILLGSFTAFFIGRKLGAKAVRWIVGEETLDKWQKKLKGKDNFVLTVMFLLPLFPDDILCFVAGLSSMSNKYFIIMIVLARLLAVGTTCYSINIIPFNTWWGLSIWAVFLAVVVGAFIYIYKHLDAIQAKFTKIFNKKKDK